MVLLLVVHFIHAENVNPQNSFFIFVSKMLETSFQVCRHMPLYTFMLDRDSNISLPKCVRLLHTVNHPPETLCEEKRKVGPQGQGLGAKWTRRISRFAVAQGGPDPFAVDWLERHDQPLELCHSFRETVNEMLACVKIVAGALPFRVSRPPCRFAQL